ncbi:MAG: substrate-binding domain-containing protein [Nitrospirae bacterium]|nr:substrate-binding domain-containing protein [Nitrospirota bacterium]
MKTKIFFGILSVVFLVTSAFAVSKEIKIGGGAAPVENVLKPIKEPFEKATGIKLNIVESGPKAALMDLEKGKVDAATAGLALEDWISLIEKDGHKVQDKSSLNPVVIGKDNIRVIINKDNPVAMLSKEQLKGIFTGKITNWKAVGGKDLPIIVVWGKLIPGTNDLFTKHIMEGGSVTKSIFEVATAADIKQKVSATPGAIGIGPAAAIDASIKSPQTPEISRPIVLLTKGKPSETVQKLLEFIKGEGQKYIKG